jgi:hypothetical protein
MLGNDMSPPPNLGDDGISPSRRSCCAGAVKSASDRENPESLQPLSVGVAGNTPPYGLGTLTGHFAETV